MERVIKCKNDLGNAGKTGFGNGDKKQIGIGCTSLRVLEIGVESVSGTAENISFRNAENFCHFTTYPHYWKTE